MTDWSNACQEAWQTVHQYANEKNSAGVLAALLTLFIAFQFETKEKSELVVQKLHKKLRNFDSPIYLLAKKPSQRNQCFYFPTIENDQVVFKQVNNELFVQLETCSQHEQLVKQDWKTEELHEIALGAAGFSL